MAKLYQNSDTEQLLGGNSGQYFNNNKSVPKICKHIWPLGYPNFQICSVIAEYDLLKTHLCLGRHADQTY